MEEKMRICIDGTSCIYKFDYLTRYEFELLKSLIHNLLKKAVEGDVYYKINIRYKNEETYKSLAWKLQAMFYKIGNEKGFIMDRISYKNGTINAIFNPRFVCDLLHQAYLKNSIMYDFKILEDSSSDVIKSVPSD